MKLGDLVRWRDVNPSVHTNLIGIIVKETKPGWKKVHWLSGIPSYSALIWDPCTREPVIHLEMLSEGG